MATDPHLRPLRTLKELVAQRTMLDEQINTAITDCFRKIAWTGAEPVARTLGISRSTFYRRYGHLNEGTAWKRRQVAGESHE
jgi:transcriptional regulator of acetoin/glycerol metabolism